MTEPPHLRTTRTFYDTVAADYDARYKDGLQSRPLERAMLAAFAELVRTAGDGPVADLGCGQGRVTAHLDTLGLDVFGVDLSPGMLALARKNHPDLPFYEGSMAALDLADGALHGIVAWYSIIHTPPELLPEVFAEFRRVLAPGGQLLLAFQTGDEPLHLERPLGHPVSLDFLRWSPDDVAELLALAGFAVDACLLREPIEPESVPQAYLLAHNP